VGATLALATLRFATPDVARTLVTVFGTVVILSFAALPLAFGIDDTIDPRRFTLYGIRTPTLAFGLAIAALVSVPSLVVTLFALAQVFTWTRDAMSTTLAIVGAVVIVATCVLTARVSSAIAAFFLASRRARDISGILVLVVLAGAAPLVAVFASVDWGSTGLPIMRRIAAIASWSPFGAIWSVPGDAALGRIDVAMYKLLIAVVFLVALWFAWRALVAMMLVTPQQEAQAKHYLGLGWFERLPATSTGAIAARSLSYWSRDARYRVSLFVIPIVPVVMIVALAIAGVPVPLIAWVPVPIMCLFLGWAVHNDIAFDSTAFWVHVSANTSGVSDRLGRLAPGFVIGLPMIVVGSVITAAIANQWVALPALIGLSACILLVGLGMYSVISAAFPYPAVRPGDSPFAQPQAAGSAGSIVQGVSFFAIILSSTPVMLLSALAAVTIPLWYWVALLVGLAIGILALVNGVRWGARIVSARAPELLAFTLQN
jgi:ABC-2 type transport system permease protein